MRRRRISFTFLLTVVAPTLLAAVYYGLLASDVYTSESRFVVRTPQRDAPTGLGALLQGTAFARSQDDTYSVHDFMRSRDALRELDDKLQLRASYTRPEIDFVNRFPGLDWDDSFENFHRYYEKHVVVEYDSASSITVLKVRAYAAADAAKINEMLLQMGERLVNNLNARSREDLIRVAEREVTAAAARARQAAAAVSGFRAGRNVFDPNQQSAIQLQSVVRLKEELLAAEDQLAQVTQVSPGNPQVSVLRNRVASLRQAVAAEEAKVAGGGAGSFAGKAPEYERLQLEKTFADRQLASALAALDSARSEAARKQLYLERLVQPNVPDRAMDPRRLRSTVTVFVIGLILWGVVSLVLASIREHAE